MTAKIIKQLIDYSRDVIVNPLYLPFTIGVTQVLDPNPQRIAIVFNVSSLAGSNLVRPSNGPVGSGIPIDTFTLPTITISLQEHYSLPMQGWEIEATAIGTLSLFEILYKG